MSYDEVYIHQVQHRGEIQTAPSTSTTTTTSTSSAPIPTIQMSSSSNYHQIEVDAEGVFRSLIAEPTTDRSANSIILTGDGTSNSSGSEGNHIHAGGGGHSESPQQTRRLDPPSYEEVVDPEGLPPPSYDSLFGRVRNAQKSSKGLVDFAKNVLILLLGTLGCSIILCVTIVIPVCMIVFGLLYMYDCPQGEYIPVYLLVGGGFGVLKQLLHLSTRVRSQEDQAAERLRQSPTQQLINCFMFGWFIIGSFWIFKEYEPNYDPSKGKYCNKSLYMFAFWLITSVYISLGLLILGLCAIAVGSIASHRRSRTNNHTSL